MTLYGGIVLKNCTQLLQRIGMAIAFVVVASMAMVLPVFASTEQPQTLAIEHRLSLSLAMEAATVAIESCASQGAAVSASVVDQHGQTLLQLRGDQSAPHTFELSLHKAYTAVSLAPLQGMQRSSEVAVGLRARQQPIGGLALPAAPLTKITPIAGATVIKLNSEVLGALGISGARSGMLDESCAEQGLASIQASMG